VGRIWGCFFEGFLLDVTYEDLVPLCLVTLIQQTLRNGFDLGVFGDFLWKAFLRVDFRFLLIEWVLGTELLDKGRHEVPHLSSKSHFDPWNESGDRLVEGLSFSRGLSSSRLSRPRPV
jgi:hypothetical protein